MSKRNDFVDIIRGVAVVGMLIYHMVFVLDFVEIINFDIPGSLEMFILGNVVRILFFVTAGISSLLIFQNANSKKIFLNKLWLRFLKIFEAAVIVSLVSFVFYEEYTVYFGVLHAIAFSCLISGLIIAYRKLNIFLVVLFFVIEIAVGCTDKLFPIMYVLGFSCTQLQTFDYFPLFPWMGLVLLGQLIGSRITSYTDSFVLGSYIARFFGLVGRNALRIYLLHIPVFIALAQLYKITFAK